MWWLIALTLAAPASAQRPFCDFGTSVAALREAQIRLATPVTGLIHGREAGLAIAALLDTAGLGFTRCGCLRLAEQVGEAARLAEQSGYEASVARIADTFTQAGFRAQLTRQAMDSRGCR